MVNKRITNLNKEGSAIEGVGVLAYRGHERARAWEAEQATALGKLIISSPSPILLITN